MSKILIALDESTVATGWSVFRNEELIDYGVFKEKSKNVIERISNISKNVDKLLDKYTPDNLAIENVQITLSAPTAKSLMGLQTILELKAFERNINYELIRTTSWRKILGLSNNPKLKRQEKKQETIDYVNKKYGLNETSNDICDSIAIGTAFIIEKK